MCFRSFPYLIGRREPCEGFRNMDAATGATAPTK